MKNMITRREAIKTSVLAGAAMAMIPDAIGQQTAAVTDNPAFSPKFPYELPPLPYAYDALEPFIDVETMRIHHDKHHAAYTTNLNKAVDEFPELKELTLEAMLKDLDRVPAPVHAAIRNNGGGYLNHALFWRMMKPGGGGEPAGELATAIAGTFGSYANFKAAFSKAAMGQFGSGWAWLVATDHSLEILALPNQDSPLSVGKVPLLGLDIWEHAYYLKHQNKRVDYVDAWWNTVNWDYVTKRWARVS